MAKDLIARIVVDGSPYEWRGAKVVVETSCSKASELIRQAVNSSDWPSSRVLFTVTPGGFIQAPMPNDYDHQGLRSWESRPEDFQRLVPFAEKALWQAENARRERREKMENLARRFKPTMVLHHPHQTDQPSTWGNVWPQLRRTLAFNGPYASGIAYFPDPRKSSKARGPLDDVLRKTAGGGVSDIRVVGFWSEEWQRY